MNLTIHIALLLGSVREGRKTDRVARYLLEQLQQTGRVNATLLDLQAEPLPMFASRWKEQPNADPNLKKYSDALHTADGIVLISPEYHGSYTGVLKNAVDHFWDEFKRKPMGVVSTGAGKMGGINGSTEMQNLILSLGAFPMPYKLLVPFVKEAFDEEATPLRDDMGPAVEKFVNEFVWFTRALTVAKLEKVVQNSQSVQSS